MSNTPEADPPDEIGFDAAGRPIVRLEGQVEVNNLQFGFNPNMPPLIEDFSLKLNPGKSVALVGGSGSGKSTIAKIVCGLYKPLGGEIFIDGTDLSKIPSVVFRNTLGFVEQEFGIFEGTIRDNLTLLDRPSRRECIQAAKDAEIHDVIQNMPKGYETTPRKWRQSLRRTTSTPRARTCTGQQPLHCHFRRGNECAGCRDRAARYAQP